MLQHFARIMGLQLEQRPVIVGGLESLSSKAGQPRKVDAWFSPADGGNDSSPRLTHFRPGAL